VCDLRSGKYDFDLAQRKYEKNDKRQNQRNDLTLEIKERIKEYYQELSPEQIVGVCSKRIVMCVQSLFINIFGKIKGICI
jgi:IS30 family transposase